MLQLSFYQFQVNFNQFSILGLLSAIISYSPIIAWALTGFVILIFSVISIVLSYHWKSFGLDMSVMKKAAILYFSVSGSLLVIMIISLAVYLNSLG